MNTTAKTRHHDQETKTRFDCHFMEIILGVACYIWDTSQKEYKSQLGMCLSHRHIYLRLQLDQLRSESTGKWTYISKCESKTKLSLLFLFLFFFSQKASTKLHLKHRNSFATILMMCATLYIKCTHAHTHTLTRFSAHNSTRYVSNFHLTASSWSTKRTRCAHTLPRFTTYSRMNPRSKMMYIGCRVR